MLPSGLTSRIERIDTPTDRSTRPARRWPSRVLLADDLDISRGDMICRPHNQPDAVAGPRRDGGVDGLRLPAGAAPGVHAEAHDAHGAGDGHRPALPPRRPLAASRHRRHRAGAQRDRAGRAAGHGADVRRRLPPQPGHRQLRADRRGDEPDGRRRHAPHRGAERRVERRSGTTPTVEPRRPLGGATACAAPRCGSPVCRDRASRRSPTPSPTRAARTTAGGVRARRRQRPPRAQRRPRVLGRRPGRERPPRRRGRPADGRRRPRRARAGDQPVPGRPRPGARRPRRRRAARSSRSSSTRRSTLCEQRDPEGPVRQGPGRRADRDDRHRRPLRGARRPRAAGRARPARRSGRRRGRPPLSGGGPSDRMGPCTSITRRFIMRPRGRAGGAAHPRVRRVVPHVRQHRRRPVHRPHGDRVGHARPRPSDSPDDPAAYSVATFARRACWRILDDVGVEQAVHARPLARRLPVAGDGLAHPERAAALVLVDTGPGFRNDAGPRRLERDGRGLRPATSTSGPRRPARQRRAERQRAPQRRRAGARRPRRAAASPTGTCSRRCRRSTCRRWSSSASATSRSSRVALHGRQDPERHARRDRRRRPRPARQPSRRVQRRAAHRSSTGWRRPMSTQDEVRADVRAWLAEHWDPDLALLDWRRKLVDSRAGRRRRGRPTGTAAACPAGPTPIVARGVRRRRCRRRRPSAAG